MLLALHGLVLGAETLQFTSEARATHRDPGRASDQNSD